MSVASLLRPTVPVIVVAPFNMMTPETVNVMAAEVALLKVMVSVPTDPSITSTTFAAAVMSPLTVMTSANSSHSLTLRKDGSMMPQGGHPRPPVV